MKAEILNIEGKKAKEIEAPAFFSLPVRIDLISKILEAKKKKQPYAPSPVAGMQYAASGKIVHRRHVWRSGYGRGISRIPRKIISRRGSQFNWIGAEISSTRGGRRAHPPKIASMINHSKINKKEEKAALLSALSATANKKEMASRYERLEEKDIRELPFIVESKLASLSTKEALKSMKHVLGEKVFSVAMKKRNVRSGRGKRRGRKYKSNAGMLIVLGNKEKMKASIFSVKNAGNLGIVDLADGGPGRITIYTEQAIKDIEEKISGGKAK